MKFYLRIFIVAFICFVLFFGSALFAFDKYYDEGDIGVEQELDTSMFERASSGDDIDEIVAETKLDRLVRDSDRINVLIFGIDGERTDTIMVASFDPEKKLLDLVNIPRDTYHYVEGFNNNDQKKINAVYGFRGTEWGSLGLKREVENLLSIPIHNYVKVNYTGVEAVVNVLGGIEVNVPFDMRYDDPKADPPLHIDLKKGVQVLEGSKALEYLRWRKNNDGFQDSDLARIKRQQDFMKLMAKKSLSFKLPVVANTVFKHIKTDMTLSEATYYATKAVGFDMKNMSTYTLPGEPEYDNGMSYYMKDEKAIEALLISIYESSEQ